jgi:hypothetical protein
VTTYESVWEKKNDRMKIYEADGKYGKENKKKWPFKEPASRTW